MPTVPNPRSFLVTPYPIPPSTRVTTAACVDRRTMADMVEAPYDLLEGYEKVTRYYGSLEHALMEEKLRGDLLEQDLDILRDVMIQLRGYVQQRLIVFFLIPARP